MTKLKKKLRREYITELNLDDMLLENAIEALLIVQKGLEDDVRFTKVYMIDAADGDYDIMAERWETDEELAHRQDNEDVRALRAEELKKYNDETNASYLEQRERAELDRLSKKYM